MRVFIFVFIVVFGLLTSCKSRSTNKSSSKEFDPSTEPNGAENSEMANFEDSLCSALKDPSFPTGGVSEEVSYLCDNAGFAALRANSFTGTGVPKVTSYRPVQNKTMYFAVGFSLPGSVDKIAAVGKTYCEDFNALRAGFRGKGLESVERVEIQPNSMDEFGCNYKQIATVDWTRVRADALEFSKYGFFQGINVGWRMDSMVTPVSYSPVQQSSGLLLGWQENSRVQGVYLIKIQVDVVSPMMGTVKTRVQNTLADLVLGLSYFIN